MANDKVALLNASVFITGCSLIWLNLWVRPRDATTVKQNTVPPPRNENERPAPELVEEISIAPQLPPVTALPEEPAIVGEGGGDHQNSYAAHVASAVSKSRRFQKPTSSR
jgi:hypothetical protein